MPEQKRKQGSEVVEAARDLCRTLLQSNPRIPYKEVRQSGENLGLPISRWMFGAVQRELAGTVGGRGSQRPEDHDATGEAATEAAPENASDAGEARQMTFAECDDSRIRSPVMAFAVKHLREHPLASFQEVKAAAKAAGIVLYPITYGRAQALLGIVKTRPRRKAARRAAPGNGKSAEAVEKRPLVQRKHQPSTSVDDLLREARAIARERDRYRSALETLRQVLIDALRDESGE